MGGLIGVMSKLKDVVSGFCMACFADRDQMQYSGVQREKNRTHTHTRTHTRARARAHIFPDIPTHPPTTPTPVT